MSVRWEDIDARAAGLASRLLRPEALAELARARDLQELSRGMAAAGVLPEEMPDPTADALDLAQRRAAARMLGLARWWLGNRAQVVAVELDAEDRRSVRALVRGAAAGVRAAVRLAGLIPSPALPERLLEELAGQARIRDQAALLVATGHPLGGPLLEAAATQQEPDLFSIELALDRAFAARALGGARRGGRFLREYVGDLIDLDNCRAALFLARGATGEPPPAAFLDGGRRLSRRGFDVALAAGGPEAAALVLGRELGDAAVAVALRRHAGSPAALERAFERWMAARLQRESRLDPLGPAPFLLYCHRLREETTALSELIWSVSLGLPPPRRRLLGAGAATV